MKKGLYIYLFAVLAMTNFAFSQEKSVESLIASNLISFQLGNSNNYFHPYDTVAFVSWTLPGSPLMAATRIGGLKPESRVEDLLKEPDYNTLLVYLWSEPTQEARIAWLRKRAVEGYPILMLELAKELVAIDIVESWKWCIAGLIRVQQDALCIEDDSLGSNPLGILFDAYAGKFLSHATDSYKGFQEGSKGAISVVEGIVNYPSPIWIGYHGMDMYTAPKGSKPKLKPENTWGQIRSNYLKNQSSALIEQIDKLWQQSKSKE